MMKAPGPLVAARRTPPPWNARTTPGRFARTTCNQPDEASQPDAPEGRHGGGFLYVHIHKPPLRIRTEPRTIPTISGTSYAPLPRRLGAVMFRAPAALRGLQEYVDFAGVCNKNGIVVSRARSSIG